MLGRLGSPGSASSSITELSSMSGGGGGGGDSVKVGVCISCHSQLQMPMIFSFYDELLYLKRCVLWCIHSLNFVPSSECVGDGVQCGEKCCSGRVSLDTVDNS